MSTDCNKKLSVTIIRNSECLPSDANGARLWRSGVFAKYFFTKGYDVNWVFSSFDHYNKINRPDVKNEELLGDVITMIKTPGYKSNLSVMRFVDHFLFGVKLFIYLVRNNNSEVLICSYPTPESAFFVTLYGKIFKRNVILDIRDQWPDVIFETLDKKNNLALHVLLSPYLILKKLAMKMATNFIAVNEDFLNWALSAAGRPRNAGDFVSHIPFLIPEITVSNINSADALIRNLKIRNDEILISFAGTLGLMFDFQPFFELYTNGSETSKKVKLLVCGTGDKMLELKEKFSSVRNVCFAGQVDSSTVYAILQKSDLLLAPYRDLTNFRNHLPNKFMEYCSAGKPIISSLRGIGGEILCEYDAGSTYQSSADLEALFSKYLSDPDFTQLQSRNAKELYLEKFHPDLILKQLEEKVVHISER